MAEPVDSVEVRSRRDVPLASLSQVQQACRGAGDVYSNAHTQERTEQLLARKAEGLREEVVLNTEEHQHSIFHGTPDFVKLIKPDGMVFRHYFQDPAIKKKAVGEHSLMAGPVSYAQASSGIKKDFVDLTGVFMTVPGVDPGTVGVPGLTAFVDMTLPEDTPLLEIEPGRIYMVAGEPKRPDWVVEYYRKYKAGEAVPEYTKKMLQEIDARGGIKEPTRMNFYEVQGK